VTTDQFRTGVSDEKVVQNIRHSTFLFISYITSLYYYVAALAIFLYPIPKQLQIIDF